MALSDPTNVRLGLARKQDLLKRLAQQMAARGPGGIAGRGSRATGTGAQFASSVGLRTGGPARVSLPFVLPAGRARPGGFDPSTDTNPWDAPQAASPVIPGGPPAGEGAADPVTPDPTGQGLYTAPSGSGSSNPDQYATAPSNLGGVDPGFNISPGDGSFLNPGGLNQPADNGVNPYFLLNPYDQSAALNQRAAPDPYTAMATAQMQRITGRRVAS